MRHALFMSSIKRTHFLCVPQDHISRLQMTFPTPLGGVCVWTAWVAASRDIIYCLLYSLSCILEWSRRVHVRLWNSAFTVFFSVTKSVLLYWSGWNVSISQYILYVLIYFICGGTVPFGFQPDTVMFYFLWCENNVFNKSLTSAIYRRNTPTFSLISLCSKKEMGLFRSKAYDRLSPFANN